MQDVTGVRPEAESFFAGLAGFCALALETFFEDLHRLSLYQQTVVLFQLFGTVLQQVLVHPRYLSHPSAYQQSLGFWVLFGCVILQGSLPSFFHVPNNHHLVSLLHFLICPAYHCMQIVLQDLL